MLNYEKIGIFEDNRFVAEHERIDWHSYFMNVAYLVSLRSHDSQTRHGICLVRDNTVIGTGYNGFPSGLDDSIIPNVRPAKYAFMNHAEESAIFIAAKNGISINGCTAYITGHPCSSCARKLVSVGVLKWIIGHVGYQSSEEDFLLRNFWIENFNVSVTQFSGKLLVKNDIQAPLAGEFPCGI